VSSLLKSALAAGAVLLLAGTAAYLLLGRTPAQTGLRTAGIIEGREVNLSSQVLGRIATVCCREGDAVKAGQLTVVLDSRDLAAALAQAEAEANKAKVQQTNAAEKLERTRSLVGKHFVSRQDLDDAVAAQSQADAGYAAAEAAVDYDRVKLSEAQILSPLDGTVVYQGFAPGEMVSPGQTVLTVVDTRHLYARVDVDETRIGGVALGAPAIVTTIGEPPRELAGRVSEIGRYADFATQRDVTRGRQDIRTFRVKVEVNDPSGVLKPGMTVEVSIPAPVAP
jgi:RND family efflux transporter MFP subunit